MLWGRSSPSSDTKHVSFFSFVCSERCNIPNIGIEFGLHTGFDKILWTCVADDAGDRLILPEVAFVGGGAGTKIWVWGRTIQTCSNLLDFFHFMG